MPEEEGSGDLGEPLKAAARELAEETRRRGGESARGGEADRDQLITARVSPLATEAPTAIGSSVTVPDLCAVISFSIFMASITAISAPSSTAAPCSTATFSTVPWIGETSVSAPPPPPPPARSPRLGGLRAAAAAAPAAGAAPLAPA